MFTFGGLLKEFIESCNHHSLSHPTEVTKRNVRNFREELRKREFEAWTLLPSRGKGIVLYKEISDTNKLILNKRGMSTSEWIAALKMNANVAAVRVISDRSQDETRRRHGWPETNSCSRLGAM